MASGSEMVNDISAQIIRNDQESSPNFRNLVNIETPIDDIGELPSIPPRVLTIQDIRSWYQCKIGEIKYYEIRETYDKLCIDGVLKDEFKIIADKGRTRPLGFPKVFKIEWIKIVLNRVHNMKIWLEGGLIKIKKGNHSKGIWVPCIGLTEENKEWNQEWDWILNQGEV